MKKTIAVFLVLILGVSLLAGCGGGTTLTGKYNLVSMTQDGEEQSIEDLKTEYESYGMGDFPEFYIEFKDGSNFAFIMYGETMDGTFTVNGKSVELTVDGEAVPGTIDGNTLTLEKDGAKMVFKK